MKWGKGKPSNIEALLVTDYPDLIDELMRLSADAALTE
jgi:hypothetical protein